MTVKMPKTEYNWLLEFYIVVNSFEPVTSTFEYLEEHERKEILLTVGVLKRKLEEILPKVQNRSNARDSENVAGRSGEDSGETKEGNNSRIYQRDSKPIKTDI